jgi:hypothetical protein
MAQIRKKTVRKLVTLPVETAERAEQFRIRSGATSESDALKVLIERGLERFDTREDLFARCEAATAAGQSIGDIINLVLADHPLISRTTFDSAALCAYLMRDDPEERDFRFRYSRNLKKWFWEYEETDFNNHEWREIERKTPTRSMGPANTTSGGRPASRASKAELDDDIPF